jgi:hypothetical protein
MGEAKRRKKAGPADPSTFEGLIVFSPKTEPPWLEMDAGGRYCKVVSLELLRSQQATCIFCPEILDEPALVGVIVADKGHSIGAFGVCESCKASLGAGLETRVGDWLVANFGGSRVCGSPMMSRWFKRHAN